nr:peptide chain release factor N(5)-glutamine methyltransferase [Acidiferrimicrobium sp. IK]
MEEAAPDAWPTALDQAVTQRAGVWFEQMVERRAAGEPLQYVVGHWPFRTLDLMVDGRVLIPRPETEAVVEVALEVFDAIAAPDPVAVDLGTGSGAIALSLAKERRMAEVWATDESPDALAVAGANLAGLGGWAAPKVRLARGAWWQALPEALRGRVTLAVSNPPYISSGEMASLDAVVRDWEPNGALEAGPTGLEDVAAITGPSCGWLMPGGALVVEIAPHQAEDVAALARDAGLVDVEVRPDLAGRPRALVGRAPQA